MCVGAGMVGWGRRAREQPMEGSDREKGGTIVVLPKTGQGRESKIRPARPRPGPPLPSLALQKHGKGRTGTIRRVISPGSSRVPHEVVAVGGHHVGAHGLGADEVEGVGQRLAHVSKVPHHLGLSLEQGPDGDAALDHCHPRILKKNK